MKPSELFDKPTMRLTPSIVGGVLVRDVFGLIQFRSALWVGGKELDHLTVVSGQASNQLLQKCSDRIAGSGAPIGEGVYDLGDPDATRRVNWASGKVGDYGASFKAGLGPIWIGIHAAKGYKSTTYDLGQHADWNQDEGYPGTNGCMGVPTPGHDLTGLKRLAGWYAAHDIAQMVVDLGLGTVPRPTLAMAQPAPPAPAIHRAKLYARPGVIRGYRDEAETLALSARVDFHDGRLGVALNGEQLDASKIESLTLELAYKKAGK